MTKRSSWVAAADIEEFTRTTIPLLSADAARNTLILTVFARLASEGPHVFGQHDPQMLTWHDAQGEPAGAVLRTPPHGFLLSDVPDEAVTALIGLLLDPGTGLDGREINLPESDQRAFAAAWTARTGHEPRVLERFRLYRLGELLPPKPAPEGAARRATQHDVEFVSRWLLGFWSEAEPSMPGLTIETALQAAVARIAEGCFWVWINGSGTPVSLAGHTPIVAGMGRIGPVYTPPEQRGHGYGAGVTAAVSQAVRARGADEVLLFTDLANPVSNRLYQRLGYLPVNDRTRLELTG